MKRKKLFLLVVSTCLILAVALSPFMAACAKPAVEPGAAEIGALQKEVAALEKEVATAEKKASTSEKEAAALEKEIAKLEAAVPTPAEEAITWRMQGYGGAEMDFWAQDFLERVEDTSGGRMKIDWYYGGSIVPNTELLTAVGSGQLDGSLGCSNYWPSEIDVAILESALFGFNDLTQAYKVWYEKGMVDLFREAYTEHNCYYLGPSFEGISLGGIDLMMNAPVHNLDDMRKLKVRAAALTAKVLGPLGVSTVYIPAQEMYTAAATGVIDATVYGSYVLNDLMGFAEVFKYYLVPSWNAPWCSCWFVNTDSFNALPEDLKAIVESAYYANNHYTCPVLNQKMNVESIEHLKAAGVTFMRLDDESWKALIASAMDALDEEAAKSARAAKAVEMIKEVKREAGLLD